MVELLVSLQESDTADIAIVLDLSVDLVEEESLHCIVEFVFVQVASNITNGVVRPVCVLDSMQKAIVLSDPQSVL